MSDLTNHLEALDDCAPEDRETLLAQLLATAWERGYNWCYNDGAEADNPYLPLQPGEPATFREALERQQRVEQATLAAEALARCTGSTSASYTICAPDGTELIAGHYER